MSTPQPPNEGQSWYARPSNVPETQFLTHYSAGPERWGCQPETMVDHPPVHRLYLPSDDSYLLSHPADASYRTILAPTDPVKLLLLHRALVERLRTAIGSRRLFERHLMPVIAGWGAMVQSLPRDERGLWSGADGLFEAGLMFAIGALSAIDARVIGTNMAPRARDEWTARLRVAAAIAGIISDSRKLAQLKLEAGSENPSNGQFDVISQFNPSEETALQFAVKHIGRVMRLTRYTPKKAAGRLPTVSVDILRLVVPVDTLKWLGVTELDDGETVLTALKAAVTYATGYTDAERMISEAVARGREWATNRRSAEAARREGSSPLMRGFASVFEADLRRRVLHGKWRLNDGESPIVWAEDGIYLAWPRTFTEITASAEDNWLFRDVPDEPNVAADILASADMIFRSEAGHPVWMTDDQAPCHRGAWLRVTDSQGFIALARRAADKAGEILPQPLAPIFDKDLRKENESKAALKPIFLWRLHLPGTMVDDARPLFDAVERINKAKVGQVFTHPEGLFVPEILLPSGWWMAPGDAEPALVTVEAPMHPLVVVPRRSYARKVLMMNEGAKIACQFDLASRKLSLEPHVLEGIVISHAYLTPIGRWPGSGETELPIPSITDLQALDLDEQTVTPKVIVSDARILDEEKIDDQEKAENTTVMDREVPSKPQVDQEDDFKEEDLDDDDDFDWSEEDER